MLEVTRQSINAVDNAVLLDELGQRVTFLSLSPPRWLNRLILFYLIPFSIIWLFPFLSFRFYHVCTPKRNFTRARSRTDNCHLAGCCCCCVVSLFLFFSRWREWQPVLYLVIRSDCRVVGFDCIVTWTTRTYSPYKISRAGSNLDNTFHFNGQLRANGCRYRLSGYSRLRAHRQLFRVYTKSSSIINSLILSIIHFTLMEVVCRVWNMNLGKQRGVSMTNFKQSKMHPTF
jgi:hypothetical protein